MHPVGRRKLIRSARQRWRQRRSGHRAGRVSPSRPRDVTAVHQPWEAGTHDWTARGGLRRDVARPEDDPRTESGPAGELATIREYLSNHRLTLGMKCEDLS